MPTAPYAATLLPMSKVRDEAVCIRRWDFSETSQTVSLFGRGHGVVRGLAKGAKREKGQFSGGIELLTRGEVLFILRKGRDLAAITDWSLLEIYPALSRSLRAHRAALYLADLVAHLVREGDPHARLYDCMTASLRALADERSVARIVLAFQWTALAETGFRPTLGRGAQTGEPLRQGPGAIVFSAAAGGVTEARDAEDGWRVRPETIALLRRLDAAAPAIGDVAPASFDSLNGESEEVVERASRLLAAYLRHILDRELATARQLFGEPATS